MADVVTVTLNAAVDVSTTVDVVRPEHKLRCDPARTEPGGGGVNVARVAARLGSSVEALVVAGGSTGNRLLELLALDGIPAVAIEIDGLTRQSFSVNERSTGAQYRFVLPGPPIDDDAAHRVIETLASRRPSGCLVVSGSMPPGTPDGFVADLIDHLDDGTAAEIPVVVDTSGPELERSLMTRAAVVKPSARELSAVVGRELATEGDVLAAATEVAERSTVGAILASIGAGGALLVRRGEAPIRLRPPTVKVVSAVGAGDSMVAGVATGLARGLDLVQAAALGVAAGTAAVMTPGSELCQPERVDQLHPLVRIDG